MSLGVVRNVLMELTAEMRACLDEAVLCWVATADVEGQPNVSPKAVFAAQGDAILVAPSSWLFPDAPEDRVRQRALERYVVRDR